MNYAATLEPSDFVIDDDNFQTVVNPTVDGNKMGSGLIPRNYETHPQGYLGNSAPPFDLDSMPLIPREEWPERQQDMIATESQLSNIRATGNNGGYIPAKDQNGQGYCWFYSGTACVQLLRAVANLPYVALSGHSGAWVIKNGRNQGGWGAQGLDFMIERGIVPEELWPAKSMDGRRYNTEENWEVATQYKVIEGFVDLAPAQYNRDMTFDQVVTCLLSRIPVIGDFNWWGHSVALMDLVKTTDSRDLFDVNTWGTKCLNSWTDNWGRRGEGVLKGRKGIPNGGAAPRVVMAA